MIQFNSNVFKGIEYTCNFQLVFYISTPFEYAKFNSFSPDHVMFQAYSVCEQEVDAKASSAGW